MLGSGLRSPGPSPLKDWLSHSDLIRQASDLDLSSSASSHVNLPLHKLFHSNVATSSVSLPSITCKKNVADDQNSDLVMCRKQSGIAIGRLCDKCDGKCPVCDSYVRPTTLVRICDECSFGNYQNKCVVCGGEGISDAFYCFECTRLEKDRDGCPKIINLGSSRTDLFCKFFHHPLMRLRFSCFGADGYHRPKKELPEPLTPVYQSFHNIYSNILLPIIT